jgi:hypothetical protein
MNSLGENVGLIDGGNIDGDLDIVGDLNVTGTTNLENFTAVNGVITGTLDVNRLVNDIKTEDTLIHLGLNNPSDNLNLGYFEEWNDGSDKRYSGIIRDRTTKKQYLFENTLSEPNSTTDISLLPRGSLAVGTLEISNYQMPTADGTPGQIISTDGAGNLSFTNDTGGTLQTAYDLSTAPQITTSLGNDTMVFKKGGANTSPILEIQDETGLAVLEHRAVTGGLGGESSLTVGDPSYFSANLIARADNPSLTIYADDTAFLNFRNGADRFLFSQTSTNSDQLRLDFGILPGDDTRMTVKPSLGETTFGPDEKILLRDTGQIVCEDLSVRSDTGDDVTVVIDSGGPGTDATLKVGQTDVNDARIDIQSTGRSFLEFGSSGQNLIKFTPFNAPSSRLWCIENIIANNNLVFAYDPFGGVDRRVPLKIESELVTASKLSINGVYTLPDVDGTAGQYLATDGAGVVSWESLPESSYGEQSFFANTTSTALPTVNQWEDISGVRSTGLLKDFTAQATTLTYTGVDTKTFKYSFQCTSEITTGTNEQFEIGVFVNGLFVGGRMNFQLDDTNNYPRSTSTSAVVSLSTNDTITTKIRCISSPNESVDVFAMVSNCVSVTSGQGGGGGGGGTLQDAYNLSVTPEITTDVGQGLTLRSGGASGFEDVLKIQSNTGTQTASITAGGIANFNILNVTGTSILQGGLKLGDPLATEDYDLPTNNVGASDGDILKYDLASRSFQFFSPFVYARETPRVISNNALELLLTDNPNPDLVFPGNTLKVGDSFRITSTGTFRNFDAIQTIVFRIRIGPLGPIISTLLQGSLFVGSPQYYKYVADLTCRTVGGSATFAVSASFFTSNNTTGVSTGGLATFNSLVDFEFNLSAQWGSALPTNILTQQTLIIEKIK